MSKRRRRNSRRGKSSCSMKQTISSYSFQKTIKSPLDYVVQEDHTTEKGETDSFCKEIFLSDEDEKETETFSKEKAFGQENDGFKKEKASITVQVDEDRKLRITHSVTFNDFGRSPLKIAFQSSDEFTGGETASVVVEVTAYRSSDMSLEISEMVQSDNSDVKTTLILQNEKEKEIERQTPQTPSIKCFIHPYSWNQCTRKSKQNTKQCEYVRFKVMTELKTNGDSSRNPSSLSSQEEMDCCKSCCKEHFCRPHAGGHTDTDFTLVDGSSTCSSPYGFWLPHRRLSQPDSHSNEALRDIHPPLRFADKESDVLQDLTENMVSCHINDSNVFKEQEDPQPEALVSKCQFSVPRPYKTAYCTQPYEPDAQKNLLRSSASVGHNQKGNSQMHSNSTNSQSSSYTDVQRRRRRTYPGVAYHSGHNGESKTSCRESFSSGTLSSFFMQSLLCQAETAARYHLEDERVGISERKNHNSFGSTRSQPSSSSFCGAHTIIPNIKAYSSTKTPFYPTMSDKTSEDVFPKFQHEQVETAEVADQICEDRADQESSSADPLEQSEVTESGFDEEMTEVESQVAITDDIHQKNLLIHVTPPSVCSSEEHVTDGFHKEAKALTDERQEAHSTQKKQSSIVTLIGGYEQRSLHNKSISEDIVQNYQSATEPTSAYQKEQLEGQRQHADVEEPKQICHRPARRSSSQLAKAYNQAEKHLNKAASAKVKEHLKPGDGIPKDSEETSDHWAKKRKMFKESRRWGSAEESSATSNITDESETVNSEDTRSVDMSLRDVEDRGFYTETFHSASWIYRGDDANPNETMQCLRNRPRPVAGCRQIDADCIWNIDGIEKDNLLVGTEDSGKVREQTVKISKGMGEYPWGFRIQYSKPIIVTEVDTNGAAEEAGLKVGDYVLAVNGTDVTGVPHSEAVDLARQGPDLLILTIGSDIGRTPNTPKPACRGYLHKRTQSSLLKGWRKRWFVLRHDCCLYYYRNKRDEGKSHALAVMRLEGAVVEADTSLGKPFVFKCSPAAGNRVYYFCATSNQEMRRWLEVLERAVHPITQNHVWVDVTRHNSNLPPLAVKNPECLGLLNLLDRNKDSWVQHYCILKDGCLYFYASIRSTYAIGGIYLHGYTVREQPLGFKRSTIELKTPSEEFKVFYLCAENVNENKRWIRAIKTSIGKWLPLHQALQDYMSRPPEETKM